MQSCKHCKIQIRGNKACCPLCGGPVTGTPDNPAFPVIQAPALSRLTMFRIALLLFVAFEVTMVTMKILGKYHFTWIPLAMVAAVFAIIDIAITCYYRYNVLKMMTYQVYLGMIVSVIVDIFTHYHGWSVIWVLPACFGGLIVATIIVGVALRMHFDDFSLYIILNTAVSFLQLIPYFCGKNKFPMPFIIMQAAIIVLFLGTLIFRAREMKEASSKFFNV